MISFRESLFCWKIIKPMAALCFIISYPCSLKVYFYCIVFSYSSTFATLFACRLILQKIFHISMKNVFLDFIHPINYLLPSSICYIYSKINPSNFIPAIASQQLHPSHCIPATASQQLHPSHCIPATSSQPLNPSHLIPAT